jgi:hypothetical protein
MSEGTRIEMRVGPARLTDDAEAAPRLGNSGEQIVQELNGRYYEQVVRGNVFIYSTAAAGIALLVPAVTGNHPTIWNPTGSGYNFIPLRLVLGYVAGNNAPTNIVFAHTPNAGSTIGAALPIPTFTDVAARNALLGSGKTSRMRWAPAVCTFTVIPAFIMTSGISLFTGVAATAVAPFQICVDFDGTIVMPPGNALSICTVAATTTATFTVSLIGMELPVPLFA